MVSLHVSKFHLDMSVLSNMDGQEKKILSLFSREELIFPDSTETCPYYEVDGNEVDKTVFHEQLNKLIINQMLDRLAWISIETI